MSERQHKSTEKVRLVSAHNFLWVTDGVVGIRLRLGVMWRRGLRNVCAYICVCMLEVGVRYL